MSGRGGTGGTGGATGSGGRGGGTAGSGGSGGSTLAWVGTWATGPQLTETGNNPPSPGLTNNTLRQVVFSSISGSQLRLRLSNEFGDGPVTINAVHIALSTSGSSITMSTDKAITFGGAAGVTIAQNQAVSSDPFDFALPALTKVAITIAFGSTPAGITGHPGSRTNSYLVAGNMVGAATFSGAAMAEHWYYIVGLDVMAPAGTAAVVTLGDSITDGRGSTTDMNNRWPDDFSRRLQANAPTMNKVAVLNQGIGGNAVLSGGLGPTAQARFMRDVLQMRGVKWLIVFEGVNDLGGSSNGATTAQGLITAYGSFVDMAHAHGHQGLRRDDHAPRHHLLQRRSRRGPQHRQHLDPHQQQVRRRHRPRHGRPQSRRHVEDARRRTTAATGCTRASRATRRWPTPSTSRCSRTRRARQRAAANGTAQPG